MAASTQQLQRVCDLSEDQLVRKITAELPIGASVRVGAGDDCAVVGGPRDKRWSLLKTDVVVSGVHFLPEENYRRVGWKALCRNVSDIAAMGGIPESALITLGLPPDTLVKNVVDLYAGLRKAATQFGVSIVGGETSHSNGPMFVSVAMTGWVERNRCVLRSGGKPGDDLYVTGKLGGSLASGRHLTFTPRLEEARWLTEHFRLSAMMDLSDGLGSDVPRLAHASQCGFALEESAVPRNKGCDLRAALTDGEDFELLFAVDPKHSDALKRAWSGKFPRLALSRIGALTPPGNATSERVIPHGYDHFSKSR